MNAMPHLKIICEKVVDCYKKIYGDKIHGIYLYVMRIPILTLWRL